MLVLSPRVVSRPPVTAAVELNRFVERRWFGVARLQAVGCDLAKTVAECGVSLYVGDRAY